MAKKEELDNIAGNEKLRALQAAMDKIEKNNAENSAVGGDQGQINTQSRVQGRNRLLQAMEQTRCLECRAV